MSLTTQDKAAFLKTSKNLGLDPYEFGGLIQLESGFRPNVWGGAGGKYRGLIQFGPGARQEVGLPSKEMTIAEQLPYVEKYFQQRGYKPGMGIEKAYATVLVGNPGGSLSAKDSFGTSVGAAAPRMKAGGDLYKAAKQKLGDIGQLSQTTTQVNQQTKQIPTQKTQAQLPGQPININLIVPGGIESKETKDDLASQFLKYYISKGIEPLQMSTGFKINPVEVLTNAFNTDYTFG